MEYLSDPRVEQIFDEYCKATIESNNGEVNLYLTGSYGVGTARLESDMDVHLVSFKYSRDMPFELAKQILENELEIRRSIGSRHNAKELTRHYASLFGVDSYVNHLRCLPWRYGIPAQNNERLTIVESWPLPNVELDISTLLADLSITIKERINSYLLSNNDKWLQLNARDIRYAESNFINYEKHWSSRAQVLGKSVCDLLIIDQEKIAERIESINDIIKLSGLKRRLTHQVTWTQEKVLWELIECAKNFDYGDEYRSGRMKNFGFNPSEIRDLIKKVSLILNLESIPDEVGYLNVALSQFESDDIITSKNIDVLYNTLGQWSLLMTEYLLEGDFI
ncbi:MAG TPA: hypothetical protein VMQ58_02860 [Candidatus Saccharimonadales bacterium]|jgi:hypothetical protein|nr:hypothetical protein [Candidatus Saccharimonadales bacterium]